MKKIIILILLIMFSVPILELQNYYQETSVWDFMAEFTAAALLNPDIPIEQINTVLSQNIKQVIESPLTDEELIIFSTPFSELYSFDSGTFSSLRVNDIIISEVNINIQQIQSIHNIPLTLNPNTNNSKTSISIIVSCRNFNVVDSWFSLTTILFICAMIVYLLFTFNNSITSLITEPIEKMLEDVKLNGNSDRL
jgi:hypothetical protein